MSNRRNKAQRQPYTGDTVPMPSSAARRPLNDGTPRAEGPSPRVPRQSRAITPSGRRSGPAISRHQVRRWLTRLSIAVVVLLLIALGGMLILQRQIARAVAMPDVRGDRPRARMLVSPLNILLAGVDSRPDHPEEGVRSDSLLLLHLDPLGGWANLLTIPRDSVAAIPGLGERKINAAFSYGYGDAETLYGAGTESVAGGAALATETVETFLGLRDAGTRIDYVAAVDFDGFAAMVDALGGVEVDVPRRIVDDEYPTADFGIMRIEFEPGRQRLDGTRALQYVRTRHADSDFGRAERQQQVLSAMGAALREQPLPLRPFAALRLVRAAGEAVRTTMPVGRLDALLLGLLMLRIEPEEIGHVRIEPDTVPLIAEQGSDLFWDMDGIRQITRQALTRPEPVAEQAVIQVGNGAGVGGLAGQVSAMIGDVGFTTIAPDTLAPTSESKILDFAGKPQTRQNLRETLGGMPVEERPAVEAPPGVDILIVLGEDYQRYIPIP
jgi:polyisoprenyl-teichoic acid--peptidoglycan teichoic acid transferase